VTDKAMAKYRYLTCCVLSTGPAINAMTERAREVSYRTFMRHVDRDELATVSPFDYYDWRRRPRDLTLKRDWHVSYHRSVYEGRPCYYARHSAIEYIFVER
jgi:hypothetical protein